MTRFLGLRQDGGVELGKLKHHDLPAKLDLTKLLRKHVAVLAMSGAGNRTSPPWSWRSFWIVLPSKVVPRW